MALNVKTFTGRSMADALARVKQELGASAVILHTRSYRKGGILGLGAKTVVEITAADRATVARSRAHSAPAAVGAGTPARRGQHATGVSPPISPAPLRTPPRPQPTVTGVLSEHSGDAPAARHGSPQAAGDLIRRTYAAAYAEFSARQESASAGAVATKAPGSWPASAAGMSPAMLAPAVTSPGGAHDQLTQEMRAMRRMVAQMMRRQCEGQAGAGNGPVRAGELSPTLFDQYLSLLKQEVAEELAEEVVGQVKSRLSAAQLDDPVAVKAALAGAIAQYIPVDQSAGRLEPTFDRRPRTIALIGPTGVGKTTTIAKLAACFKLKQKKKVGLITMDTYRIAAVEQLRTYAQIIGVNLHVVSNVDEMIDAARRCAAERCDVLLIDTAGRSQRDDPRLDQLHSMIRAANPHEVHLVLSSTCTQSVLLDTVERFARIRTDRIIFTKLDEAVSFGVLLNVARKVNKRLSFITTGQEVPHHIEPGRSDRLAALVLGDVDVRGTPVGGHRC
ncbi:MAG: flagellar biosynthesis protein FlhF [Phycisphaeraceae bacterium]